MTEVERLVLPYATLVNEMCKSLANVEARLLANEHCLQSQYQVLSQLNDRVMYLSNLIMLEASDPGSKSSRRGVRSDASAKSSPGG